MDSQEALQFLMGKPPETTWGKVLRLTVKDREAEAGAIYSGTVQRWNEEPKGT